MTTRKSKFDKFIHNFASKHLKKRVKLVSVLILFLILLTVFGGTYLLRQSFQIVEMGTVPIQDRGKVIITPEIK